ncbi:hypothetical protein HNQ50_001387 [Silvimonas terrae]|uniref:Uncharacterized protein n=1 Tax=Silvimonas terrae TaxID=300266 RepID=A0A840RBE1_9NEIS|nr:hypothetical protein [Silvimonas terrae]MBB5190665.1 hypothetical protein [Silvimonas terrae]
MSADVMNVFAGAMTAAAGGGVALLVSTVSKEQKISEFRQAWVDGLRAELAELTAVFTMTSTLFEQEQRITREFADLSEAEQNTNRALHEAHVARFSDNKMAALNKIALSVMKLSLRLNDRPEHVALNQLLDRVYQQTELWSDKEALAIWHAEIMTVGRAIIDFEWKRIKVGEPAHVRTQKIAYAVLVFSAVLFFGAIIWGIVAAIAGEKSDKEGSPSNTPSSAPVQTVTIIQGAQPLVASTPSVSVQIQDPAKTAVHPTPQKDNRP